MESREDKMVVIKRDAHGKAVIWCDPEIVDLVTALNDGGLRTTASCSGHGYRPGWISLADGRDLFVARDQHDVERIDAAFPLDINGQTKAERDAWANAMAAADDKASDVAPTQADIDRALKWINHNLQLAEQLMRSSVKAGNGRDNFVAHDAHHALKAAKAVIENEATQAAEVARLQSIIDQVRDAVSATTLGSYRHTLARIAPLVGADLEKMHAPAPEQSQANYPAA